MTHFLYIFYSKTADMYYVGETIDVELRLNMHNNHVFNNSFSKIANDWIVKLIFEQPEKSNILFLEKFVKRMKSRKFIEKLIEEPQILTSILSRK